MPYSDVIRDQILKRIATATERIADALEKQNTGTDIKIESEFDKAVRFTVDRVREARVRELGGSHQNNF